MTKTINVVFTQEELETFTSGLADLLCWSRGYCAGNPDSSNLPLGMEETRDLNIKLKNRRYDLLDRDREAGK